MHSQHFTHAQGGFIKLLRVLFLIALTAPIANDLMAAELPSGPIDVPRFLPDTKAIKNYFDQRGVPVDVNEVLGKQQHYCFVKAYPYSGVDTTDLYCFVKRSDRWVLCLQAFLWKTPRKEDVQFAVRDEFVDVVSKGRVVLKLNPATQ